MSIKTQKKKRYFIEILHGKNREDHRILISERIFKLNNIGRWKLYLKLILQYVNYLHEIHDKDISLFLKDVIKDVNLDSKAFKRKMGYLLGDWRCF